MASISEQSKVKTQVKNPCVLCGGAQTMCCYSLYGPDAIRRGAAGH